MLKRMLWLILAVAAVGLAGCTAAARTPSPPETAPSPTLLPPTFTALPSPTFTPSPLPTTALPPSPQPSTIATPHPCVAARPAWAPPPHLTYNAALGGGVLQALNGGMPVSALNQVLQRAGIGNYPYAAVSVDLDGDGALDAVVSLADPHTQGKPPQGVLMVFLCRGRQFQQVATFMEPATTMAWGAPIIQFAQDLNADRRAELVVSAAHCNAQGVQCEERYAILGWRGDGLRDLLRDAEQPFPSPVPFVEDPDGDGVYDFIVETGDGQRLVWRYHQGVWVRQP